MQEVRYRPIGVVHSPFLPDDHVPPRRVDSHGVEGTVEVLSEYAEGLRDLEGFSHIFLLCHLHLSAGYALTVKPPSDTVTHGVFATRSPRRPNPISLTLVRLRRIENNVLYVTDIDLVDGTPVLDIKPYTRAVENPEEVRTGWMR
jgi:tRNA-Thr(GGU) m(6)t(6)A37 methyltransferase TsaA